MKTKRKNITGPRVCRLRKSAHLTHEELAGLVVRHGGEISADEIRRIESGGRRALDDEVLLIANALGVNVDELFPRRSCTRA